MTMSEVLLALGRIEGNAKMIHVSLHPGDLHEETHPVQHTTSTSPSGRADPRPIRLALEQALSITTATDEDALISRTLTAACEVTGAVVAVAPQPTGERYLHGDPDLAARLATAAILSRACVGRPGGTTTDFALLGLPSAVIMGLGGAVVIVASATPDSLGAEAGSVIALLIAHAQAGLQRLRELAMLARRANSDPLTGLRHYRPFEERLACSEPGRTAVIAVDVDEFKRINDEYGHQAGDHALVALVDALRSALRGDDHIYRIGGDEFAVVIDVGGSAEVATIARRLLEAARLVGHTVSVGAALRLPGETGRETLLRADKALYQAKRAGRNTARLAA
jgi:diguanylate cyclase (GGDEF)-like protein